MSDTLFDMTPQGTGAYGQPVQSPAPTHHREYHSGEITSAPFSNATTSKDAAKSQTPEKLKKDARAVYDCFKERGGLTCKEIEDITGLLHQTASARINGLVAVGFVVDTGVKKKLPGDKSGRIVWNLKASTGA